MVLPPFPNEIQELQERANMIRQGRIPFPWKKTVLPGNVLDTAGSERAAPLADSSHVLDNTENGDKNAAAAEDSERAAPAGTSMALKLQDNGNEREPDSEREREDHPSPESAAQNSSNSSNSNKRKNLEKECIALIIRVAHAMQ